MSQRRVQYGERKAWEEKWRALRQHRRQIMERCQQEDEVWRKERQSLHVQLAELLIVTTWNAVFVITDNCTRQCLGLPLFVAGANVTSEIIVTALRILLPTELQFVISDRCIHFTAHAFKELARSVEFIHVEIARHRPQSNGIAEHFVRTLKEWLAAQSWEAGRVKQITAQDWRACWSANRIDRLNSPFTSIQV